MSDVWGFDIHVSDFPILPDSYKHLHLPVEKLLYSFQLSIYFLVFYYLLFVFKSTFSLGFVVLLGAATETIVANRIWKRFLYLLRPRAGPGVKRIGLQQR